MRDGPTVIKGEDQGGTRATQQINVNTGPIKGLSRNKETRSTPRRYPIQIIHQTLRIQVGLKRPILTDGKGEGK
ncbi:hypothetical protein GCM10027275_10680 [Rhabdobacter roseus]